MNDVRSWDGGPARSAGEPVGPSALREASLLIGRSRPPFASRSQTYFCQSLDSESCNNECPTSSSADPDVLLR